MTDPKAHLTGYDLKKQSQFLKRQNDAKSVITIVYGDLYSWRQRKNKAKQSQWPAIGRKYVTRRVGKNSSVWRFCAGEGS